MFSENSIKSYRQIILGLTDLFTKQKGYQFNWNAVYNAIWWLAIAGSHV